MYNRRAADALWLELRDALLAGARARIGVGHRMLIDDARPFALRLQHDQRSLDVRAAREVITFTISIGSDPDASTEVPVGLHPGRVPPFRLNGQSQSAETIARDLLNALLQLET